MTQLSISLLGRFQVEQNGEDVTGFRSDSARGLLAYLVMHPGVTHRRDALAGLLWPEKTNSYALRNLRAALSRLRDAIGDREADPAYLDITRQSIQLREENQIIVDAQEVEACIERTRAHEHTAIETCEYCVHLLEKAVARYRK